MIVIWNLQAAHLAEIAALKAAHALQLSVAHADAQAAADQPASACPFVVRVKEKVFKETVAKLDTLRAMGHFGMGSDCPASHQFGWRQPRLVPNVVGSHCEPWWRREAITLVDALLDPGMTGIEWGSGTSSRWLVARLQMLHVVEANKKYADMLLVSAPPALPAPSSGAAVSADVVRDESVPAFPRFRLPLIPPVVHRGSVHPLRNCTGDGPGRPARPDACH